MKNKEIDDMQIITAIRQLVDVMQVKVKNNLVQKSRDFKISKEDLSTIAEIVDISIMNSFTNSIDSIVRQIKIK